MGFVFFFLLPYRFFPFISLCSVFIRRAQNHIFKLLGKQTGKMCMYGGYWGASQLVCLGSYMICISKGTPLNSVLPSLLTSLREEIGAHADMIGFPMWEEVGHLAIF